MHIATPSTVSGAIRDSSSHMNLSLYLNKCQNLLTSRAAAEPFCLSQLPRGSGGTSGSGKVLLWFWVAFALWLVAMKRTGVLLSKPIYSC